MEKALQGDPLSAPSAGSARRLAGDISGGHQGVISRASYWDTDPTCAGTPQRWDVTFPYYFTDGACETLVNPDDGQTYSTSGTCASATSFASNLYQGDSCAGTPVDTREVTDDAACRPNYDASYSYSYSYSFSYGDLDTYEKAGCDAIPADDVSATMTFYFGSDTCGDDDLKSYQVWHGGCVVQGDAEDLFQTSIKYSCDATDGFHVEWYMGTDCSGQLLQELSFYETDTCMPQGSLVSLKATCGCAAGVGCSSGVRMRRRRANRSSPQLSWPRRRSLSRCPQFPLPPHHPRHPRNLRVIS